MRMDGIAKFHWMARGFSIGRIESVIDLLEPLCGAARRGLAVGETRGGIADRDDRLAGARNDVRKIAIGVIMRPDEAQLAQDIERLRRRPRSRREVALDRAAARFLERRDRADEGCLLLVLG